MISYEGIDEAELVHGLYHAQSSCGQGTFARMHEQQTGGARVTVELVRGELAATAVRPLYIDYFNGRALKIWLNPETQQFDERLYDRDAGPGAAQRVVDSLREMGVRP